MKTSRRMFSAALSAFCADPFTPDMLFTNCLKGTPYYVNGGRGCGVLRSVFIDTLHVSRFWFNSNSFTIKLWIIVYQISFSSWKCLQVILQLWIVAQYRCFSVSLTSSRRCIHVRICIKRRPGIEVKLHFLIGRFDTKRMQYTLKSKSTP